MQAIRLLTYEMQNIASKVFTEQQKIVKKINDIRQAYQDVDRILDYINNISDSDQHEIAQMLCDKLYLINVLTGKLNLRFKSQYSTNCEYLCIFELTTHTVSDSHTIIQSFEEGKILYKFETEKTRIRKQEELKEQKRLEEALAIEQSRSIILAAEQKRLEEIGYYCVICLTYFDPATSSQPRCHDSHYMCQQCDIKNGKTTCPICREPLHVTQHQRQLQQDIIWLRDTCTINWRQYIIDFQRASRSQKKAMKKNLKKKLNKILLITSTHGKECFTEQSIILLQISIANICNMLNKPSYNIEQLEW